MKVKKYKRVGRENPPNGRVVICTMFRKMALYR